MTTTTENKRTGRVTLLARFDYLIALMKNHMPVPIEWIEIVDDIELTAVAELDAHQISLTTKKDLIIITATMLTDPYPGRKVRVSWDGTTGTIEFDE